MYRNYMFDDISQALPYLAQAVLQDGAETGSRNGACKELTHVGVTLAQPWRREILLDHRKANIAAQIAETMWVLAGRNDLDFLSHYLPRAADFSDDGSTWRAGYGPRLRQWETGAYDRKGFKNEVVDQLAEVVRLLQADPLSRRAVMSIFDPAVDFADSKDIPCNNWISFSSRLSKLDAHVAIRSNDLIWGWSGINAFEWSALQEIVAGLLGVEVGALHFSITSLHCYASHWSKLEKLAETAELARVEWNLEDSPRFDASVVGDGLDGFDERVNRWFQLEYDIRTGSPLVGGYIDTFPEPMLRSWLRVLDWWWNGRHAELKEIGGTRLEYATHVSLQPEWTRPKVKPIKSTIVVHAIGLPCGVDQGATATGPSVNCERCLAALKPSAFIQHVIALHNEKDAAYGTSWKKRGELFSIIPNIARKIDRLGGSATADETSADTAIDLLVYLAKYRTWLHDHENGRVFPGQHSDLPDAANTLMLQLDKDFQRKITEVAPANYQTMLEDQLKAGFEKLEALVTDQNNYRANHVDAQMLPDAYRLARWLWNIEQDDYAGADRD